jgi:ferredoxin-type protein NapH
VAGNLLSFKAARLTLADPLAALQVVAGTLSFPASLCMGAGLVLLLAAVLGPVFCGWLCPFGLLSELVYNFRAGRKKNYPAAGKTSAKPFMIKLLLTVPGLLAVLLFIPVPWLNQLSMPGWYTRAMQYLVLYKTLLWGALLLPAALTIEAMAGKRLWCRYICPQSVLITLAGLLLPKRLRVNFTARRCACAANDRACLGSCSLALNPRDRQKAQQAQCTNCGDCADACRSRGGALRLGIRD